MRLYYCGAAFFKKMRGKVSKMSEKQNIRDHKRRLLAAKYELRKLSQFVKILIDLVICGTNIVISCPSCQEIVPLHE